MILYHTFPSFKAFFLFKKSFLAFTKGKLCLYFCEDNKNLKK